MAHHPAWVGHHTGGSRSKPTVHPCPLRWGRCGLLTNSTTHNNESKKTQHNDNSSLCQIQNFHFFRKQFFFCSGSSSTSTCGTGTSMPSAESTPPLPRSDSFNVVVSCRQSEGRKEGCAPPFACDLAADERRGFLPSSAASQWEGNTERGVATQRSGGPDGCGPRWAGAQNQKNGGVESPNVHIRGSRPSKNTTKIQREEPQREKKEEAGRKKKLNFGRSGGWEGPTEGEGFRRTHTRTKHTTQTTHTTQHTHTTHTQRTHMKKIGLSRTWPE